jgi:prepilin-type N-terminal cleavage/methylation domain-containing protein
MMAIRKHLSGQKGFTLIELLVVVAILGILATVAFPRIMDAIDDARERKALADLTVLRDALERFYLEYGVFPTRLGILQEQGYIDPGFTFKNSYGNYYFYAVRWDDAGGDLGGVGQTTPDPDTLKDYVLGDPGRTPPAMADACDPGHAAYNEPYSPLGLDPATAAYFFDGDGTDDLDPYTGTYTARDLNMVELPMSYDVTELSPDGDPDGAAWAKFKGQ